MNIPIFRAKKIDSDEYVTGFLVIEKENNKYFTTTNSTLIYNKSVDTELRTIFNVEIDPSTLAIHFPDMIDSQGNKIFASLSEDGRGGDIMIFCEVEQITGTAIYEKASIFVNGGCSEYLSEILQRKDKDYKIIGIQE